VKYLPWVSALFVVLALSQMSLAQDYCSQASNTKQHAAWAETANGTHLLIAGVASKRIFVCSAVATGYGPAGTNLTVDFEAGNSGCTAVTEGFGDLFYLRYTTVSVGGGSSTQFTVPAGSSLCVFAAGATPFLNTGWVTYVQK
jgi:hypothetical protein